MRRAFGTILLYVGLILGAVATGALLYLIWPELDWYRAHAFRDVTRTFMLAVLAGAGVGWPFYWMAGKIDPTSLN